MTTICRTAAFVLKRRITITTLPYYVAVRRPRPLRPPICTRRYKATTTTTTTTSSRSRAPSHDAQRSAYEYYRRQQESTLWFRLFGRSSTCSKRRGSNNQTPKNNSTADANIAVAWYAVAVVVGALGATYAAVPLYKVFCQTTGFGGTTQRVQVISSSVQQEDAAHEQSWWKKRIRQIWPENNSYANILPTIIVGGSSSGTRVHTWTDEEAAAKLASLKPVANADLITIRFDTTVPDDLPWSFVPVQLDVKVVPGETALSFFRVTNHSNHAITGVATYNVHPPKVGLYFQKIQCFCFEEQRLLPGETVDMPVFFFIDPEMLKDPQVSYIKSVTLSYTFFQTDMDDEDDLEDDEEDED